MNYAPQVNTGTHGEYYTINGYHYDRHFPLSWALEPEVYARTPDNKVEKFKTGPQYCSTCNYFGTIRGVFVCYCSWCARNLFEYERGGIIRDNKLKPNPVHMIIEDEDLMAYPYMKHITMDEIGCEKIEQPPHETNDEDEITNVTYKDDNLLNYYNENCYEKNNYNKDNAYERNDHEEEYYEDKEEIKERRELARMERATSKYESRRDRG
jgi:hypothetical protein